MHPAGRDRPLERETRVRDVRVGDDRLVAEGYGVVVGYDYAAGRSMPLPDSLRAALGAGAGI